MSIQNPERVVTKQDLADFYEQILPYLGGMPEVLANKFSKGDMYSTDEKMIGQWIDGKPLYQKTIPSTVPTQSNDTEISLSSLDIDTMVDVSASAGTLNTTPLIGYVGTGGQGSISIDVFYAKSSDTIFVRNISYESAAGTSLDVTIQYTKTTDSPISIGNDTDYSTDEKIIGTWIDGSPIYQRTFTGLNCTLHHENWATLCNIPSVGIVLRIDALYNNVGAAAGYNTVQIKEFEPNSNGNISVIGITSGRTITKATIQYTKTS